MTALCGSVGPKGPWRAVVENYGVSSGRRAPGLWTHNYLTCFTRAVSSCTRLYTERSSRISRAILDVAWITVVWSRPPNSLPILGSDESVSSRERYIATWRGETMFWER